MPEIVSFDKELGIIYVDSTDLVGMADLSESIESILQLANNHGLNKVMVNATTVKLLPSTLHLHSFASELSRQTPDIKYAILISKQSPKEATYIATLAQDKGLTVQIFSLQDDALSWLRQ